MDDIGKYVQERVDSQGSQLLKSVRPFAVLRDGFDPEPVGSIVLLWYRGQRYFVTAAHVLDSFPTYSHSIGTDRRWITIPGPYQMTEAPKGDRDLDRIDIGFARVSAEAGAEIEADGCHFLTADEVSEHEHLKFDTPSRSKYLFLGYPLHEFRFLRFRNSTETPNRPVIANIVPKADHESLGLSIGSHIVTEYDHKQVHSITGPQQSPKLTGLSGGGVFRFPIIENRYDLTRPTLAGITIEQDRQADRLIGTRLAVVFELMRRAS